MSEMETIPEEEQKQPEAPAKGKKAKKEKPKKSLGHEILSWILTIVVAVVAALVIRSFVFELVRVDGGSMDNTLENGEIMFVSKFDYSSTWLSLPFSSNNATEQAPRITFGNPKLLDVVICRYPGRGGINFVKRIVGMPGDTVALKSGYLYINGAQVQEESEIEGITAIYRSGASKFGPYYVPKKGDTAVLTGVARTQQPDSTWIDDVLVEINGEKWTRSRACLVMKADGKTLKLYHRNTDDSSRESREYDETTRKKAIELEAAISYDGKTYTPSEFYAAYPNLFNTELTVDEDYYFVMGDHRNNSNDSRTVGALERSAIIGHARSVVFPFANWRGVE